MNNMDLLQGANYIIHLYVKTPYRCRSAKLEKLLTIAQFYYIYQHCNCENEDSLLLFREPIVAKNCGCEIKLIQENFPKEIYGLKEIELPNETASYLDSYKFTSADYLKVPNEVPNEVYLKIDDLQAIDKALLEKVFKYFGKFSSVSLAKILMELTIHKEYMQKCMNKSVEKIEFSYEDLQRFFCGIKAKNELLYKENKNSLLVQFMEDKLS